MAHANPITTVVVDAREFELEANLLRVLAHPKRLMIVSLLAPGSRTVSDLSARLGLSIQNTSQHLRLLRDRAIVRGEREGREVRYTLTSPVFPVACRLLREGLAAKVTVRPAHPPGGGTFGPLRVPAAEPHRVRPAAAARA